MGERWMLGVGLVALCTACGASRSSVVARGPAAPMEMQAPAASQGAPAPVGMRRYVDEELGFEIVRPSAEWQLDEQDERSDEGLVTPVVLRHVRTGAQVVLQVAPDVATPTQFAERLTEGLRQQPGFTTTDPEPLALSESAVGFRFQAAQGVRGRVAVREGSPGHVLMLLATWPSSASEDVSLSVDALIEGVRPLPEATGGAGTTTL